MTDADTGGKSDPEQENLVRRPVQSQAQTPLAAGINDAQLLAVADLLFPTPHELMILAHAALHFCHFDRTTFSTHQLAKAINERFRPNTSADEVEDYTLRRFVLRRTVHPGHDPHAADPRHTVAKLGAYVISQCLADRSLVDKPPIAEALGRWDFLSAAERNLKSSERRDTRRIAQDKYFISTIGSLRNIHEADSSENIYRDFFGADVVDAPNEYKDICYFLNYRYGASPEKKQMIRTFISISTPAYNDYGVFEYRHVHAHSEMSRRSLRKGRGILQQIGGNYYFLGGSARQNSRSVFPPHGEGIQVIVAEKEQFRHLSPGYLALFLSNDNEMRPMVGRSVLVPLGQESKLLRRIKPEDFALDVFKPDKFEETVLDDLSKVMNDEDVKTRTVKFIRNLIDLEHAGIDNLEPPALLNFIRLPIRADLPKTR
jgi:hypothetical protein